MWARPADALEWEPAIEGCRNKMRLMVSVVSVAEARQAIQGGADILDVKNPAEGSLGAQAPGVVRGIRDLCSGGVELSAAIGDMPNLPGTAALAALGAASCGADYIKVGIHGPHAEEDALRLLREVQKAVHGFSTVVIAAGYADFQLAGTLDPHCLPRLASLSGIRGFLLDTAIKTGHGLLDFFSPRALRRLSDEAHAAGLLFGVAGALREQDLKTMRDIGADVVGLRTAICRNDQRSGPLEPARVRRIRQVIDT